MRTMAKNNNKSLSQFDLARAKGLELGLKNLKIYRPSVIRTAKDKAQSRQNQRLELKKIIREY
jgi:hypothetical protein